MSVAMKREAEFSQRSKQRIKDPRPIILVCVYCSDSRTFLSSDLNMGIESSKYVIHSPYKG